MSVAGLHVFVWRRGGSRVRVTGGFVGWRADGIEMTRVEASSEESDESGVYVAAVWLPVGEQIQYKFVVERGGHNMWEYSPEMEFQMDEFGNMNNVLFLDPSSVETGPVENVGHIDPAITAAEAARVAPVVSESIPMPAAPVDPSERPSFVEEPFPEDAPAFWRNHATPSEARLALASLQSGTTESSLPDPSPTVVPVDDLVPVPGLEDPVVTPTPLAPSDDPEERIEGVKGVEAHVDDTPLTPSGKLDKQRYMAEFSLPSPLPMHAVRRVASFSVLVTGSGTGQQRGGGVFENVDTRASTPGARVRAQSVEARDESMATGVEGSGGGQSPAGVALTHAAASVRKEGKLVIAMVGLPARGKTYIARSLKRHLQWMGVSTELYNVGNYRRSILGAAQPAEFFEASNSEGLASRHRMAEVAFRAMVGGLRRDVDVAIFDATNSTPSRRRWLKNSLEATFREESPVQLLFVESICTRESLVRKNIRDVKLRSPDYRQVADTDAVKDFTRRIAAYVRVYRPLEDAEEMPYVQLVNAGRRIVGSGLNGYLHSHLLYFLSNLRPPRFPIWLTRHGESVYNVQGRIGGDSVLSPRGEEYARRLGRFFEKLYPRGSELAVWTSTLRRTQITARPLKRDVIVMPELDEINAGRFSGYTYEGIAAVAPDEYAARKEDKYRYRYPGGESYQDLAHRLEPVLQRLMGLRCPTLIVGHQATLRVIYSYLTDQPLERCPGLRMPLGTVVQISPRAYGSEEVRHSLM